MDVLFWAIIAIAIFTLGYKIGFSQQYPSMHDGLKPNQSRAVEIIWQDAYQMRQNPPKIIWVERGDLQPDGRGFYNPLTKKARNCVNGLFWPYGVMIAWPCGARYSETSLAHELYHAKIYIEKGIVDAAHLDTAWKDAEGPIAKAIAGLEKAGL